MPPAVRNQPIASWAPGETVEGFALVIRKEPRQDRNAQEYLDLELADASGSIIAKAWPDSPAAAGSFDLHEFVRLKGTVRTYKGQLQLSLETCRRATEADREQGFDEALLVPSTREDIGQLFARLREIYDRDVASPPLREVAARALARHGDALREHPAAKVIHHAYRGGLLEHMVAMAELALAVAARYPQLNRDLLLLGVLFHDLGKLREIGPMPVNEYTLEGRLVGHVVLGRDLLLAAAAEVPDLAVEARLQLEHLILAHQGRLEYGSPVEPTTAEAIVLASIDDLDAKLKQVEKAREGGTGFQWVRGLGRRMWVGEEVNGGD